MQSPFKIFRKHQKVVLAGLTLMAMIGFGLGDILTKMGRTGGSRQASKDVVETNVGSLSQIEMSHLVMRRTTLHRFVVSAYFASHPEMRSLAQYKDFTQSIVYQWAFGGASRPELLESWLFRHEARQMGIVVTDPQIRDYIQGFTDNKLSTRTFSNILEQMRLSPKELFDMFREEMQGDIAQKMKVPAFLPSPEKYWEYYQQLNTREKIEAAAIPVNDFIAKVPEPAQKQVADLFEKHKSDFERALDGEFIPGFRQPRKVKLHYLILSANAVEDKVLASGPVTDKEIEEYYERNKDKDRRFHEFEAPPLDETAPIDPEFAPEKGAALDGDSDDRDSPNGASPKEPKETPEKSKDPSATPDEGPKPKDETPPSKDKEEGTDKSGEAQVPGKGTDCLSVAADDEAAPDASDKPDAKPAAKPATKSKSSAPTIKTGENDDGEKVKAGEKSAPKSEAGDSSDMPEPPALPQDADSEEAGASGPKIRGKKKEPLKIKYKPLDDALREQIRDSVINDRRKKLLQTQTNKAVEALRDLGLKFSTSKEIKLSDPNPAELKTIESRSKAGLHEIADSLGMKFGETDLVSKIELSEIPNLGKAVEFGSSDALRGAPTTIIEQAFGIEALCRVFVSEVLDGTIYICWKVQDSPEHIPSLDEPGIREQVVNAWKRVEALPLAKKRAEELAEKARQKNNDLGAALKGEKVTGDPTSFSVSASESPEFSFYRESFAPDPMRNPQPDVQLGDPICVAKPGPKFMRVVFNDIGDGEVGVALNDDASVYYVVKVLSRRPADRAAFQAAGDKLFDPSSPYSQVAGREMGEAMSQYARKMDEKYAVKWNEVAKGDSNIPTFDDE